MRPTVPDGFGVRYYHRRADLITIRGGINYGSNPKGGSTLAEIYRIDDPERLPVAEGEAVCSRKDNFNRRIGRDIALGRALKQLQQDAE